ncbi:MULTISPECIES: hypothetical protein [Tatumella]|uniref:Uncharacterized protein n=1 Tax=Tatumella punctata TaxID=399969 RepID=A0ABW1VKJ0_9GAMM|nr:MULTISPECIES: hypothetical protein [unclassified Tatumella]MBS0855637.1 hypothetical protein [Tatumella sp. JGM16]MBS0893142.1 hypothetical protein [Tatumella sp. JGM130]MBS0912414.1 hypothetical protein [Tatumella sp. JGM91]
MTPPNHRQIVYQVCRRGSQKHEINMTARKTLSGGNGQARHSLAGEKNGDYTLWLGQ